MGDAKLKKHPKQELEQKLGREEFIGLLERTLESVRHGHDWEYQLQGQTVRVEGGTFHEAVFELEYEEKPHECELELKIEWKKTPSDG